VARYIDHVSRLRISFYHPYMFKVMLIFNRFLDDLVNIDLAVIYLDK